MPLAQRAPSRLATWDDLLDVPEGHIGEIVDGELRVLPRPALSHTRSTSNLGVAVGAPFGFGIGGPGGWILLDEPRLALLGDIRVPDLAGWRRERWADVPDEGPIPLVPDWVCEVLSPSTAAEDRGPKRALYARAGIGHYWIIDPKARTLEVYRLGGDLWVHVATFVGAEKVRAEPFDAVEVDLALVWPEEPEAEATDPGASE